MGHSSRKATEAKDLWSALGRPPKDRWRGDALTTMCGMEEDLNVFRGKFFAYDRTGPLGSISKNDLACFEDIRREVDTDGNGKNTLKKDWTKEKIIAWKNKMNEPQESFVPSANVELSYEDVQIPGDDCPLCHLENENSTRQMTLLKFMLRLKFHELDGNRFGVLAGLVQDDGEVYWLDVVLHRKSPIAFLSTEVTIVEWHEEAFTRHGSFFPPKAIVLNVQGVSEEESCCAIDRCWKRGLLRPKYYIFCTKEGVIKDERGWVLILHSAFQIFSSDEAVQEYATNRSTNLDPKKTTKRCGVEPAEGYSFKGNIARLRRKTDRIRISDEVRAFNNAFGDSLHLPSAHVEVGEFDGESTPAASSKVRRGGELFKDEETNAFFVGNDSDAELIEAAIHEREEPVLLEGDKDVLFAKLDSNLDNV